MFANIDFSGVCVFSFKIYKYALRRARELKHMSPFIFKDVELPALINLINPLRKFLHIIHYRFRRINDQSLKIVSVHNFIIRNRYNSE